MGKGIIYTGILFLLITASGCSIRPETDFSAKEGKLDLRNWEIDGDGPVELKGQWLYYDNYLTNNSEISADQHPVTAAVPHGWKDHSTGYGTYTLEVLLPPGTDKLAVFTESEGSAYLLRINGKEILKNGRVGRNKADMIPDKRPASSVFFVENRDIKITMEISNFNHLKGGFRNPLLLGSEKDITAYRQHRRYTQIFTFSVYFILWLYHSAFYIFRKRNREALYFALLCLVLAIRAGVTNQKFLIDLFPFISWAISLKLEYLTFYFAAPVFSVYLSHLYPGFIKSWFKKISLALAVFYSIFTIFSGTMAASKTIPSYQIIILLQISYLVYILIRLVLNRREGSPVVASVSLLLAVSAVIDILYFRGVLHHGDILIYSFLIYMFTQAMLLSSRFARAFNKVEDLSEKLEIMNETLTDSEAKYRNLFESSSDMIILTDTHFNIEDMNPAVLSAFGYNRRSLSGEKINKLIADRENRKVFSGVIKDSSKIRNLEMKLKTANGDSLFVLLSAERRYDTEGNLAGFYGSMKDITDRKNAETERIRALKLEQMAFTDHLSGAYNRRFFIELAGKEISRARRNSTDLSISIIDIDHFKKVNDTYGHLTGDEVIMNLADYCRRNIRSIDVLARYGGEEFVLLLADIPPDRATELVQRLRSGLEGLPLASWENKKVSITISAGIAHYRKECSDTLDSLLERADKALYKSKNEGRNRVNGWDEC